jgi:hypothetical protein
MTLEPRMANLETLFAYMVETQGRMAENITTLTQIQAQMADGINALTQVQRQMAEGQIRHEQEMERINEQAKVQEGQIKILLERLLGRLDNS